MKAGHHAELPVTAFMASGAVTGGLAGCLIQLIDPGPSGDVAKELPPDAAEHNITHPGGIAGRFLAVTSLSFCRASVLGFVRFELSLIGSMVNRKSDDWACRALKIGVIIGGLLSVLIFIGIALERQLPFLTDHFSSPRSVSGSADFSESAGLSAEDSARDCVSRDCVSRDCVTGLSTLAVRCLDSIRR